MSNQNLKELYFEKIDALASSTFNKDQKELCKLIIKNTDEENLQEVFQLLIQRVKIGFTFDIAPTMVQNKRSVTLLERNDELSFSFNKEDHKTFKDKDLLIFGENFDVLNNLIVVEREREQGLIIITI